MIYLASQPTSNIPVATPAHRGLPVVLELMDFSPCDSEIARILQALWSENTVVSVPQKNLEEVLQVRLIGI